MVSAVQAASQHIRSSLVQHLSQGHFDMQTRGIDPATLRSQDATAEPQPLKEAYNICHTHKMKFLHLSFRMHNYQPTCDIIYGCNIRLKLRVIKKGIISYFSYMYFNFCRIRYLFVLLLYICVLTLC